MKTQIKLLVTSAHHPKPRLCRVSTSEFVDIVVVVAAADANFDRRSRTLFKLNLPSMKA